MLASFDALLQPAPFRDYGPNGLQVEGKAEVRKLGGGRKGERKRAAQTVVEDVQKRLTSHFSSDVSVVRKGAKGAITIPFTSDDDLARLLEKIGIKL